MKLHNPTFVVPSLLLIIMVAALLISGCATTDPNGANDPGPSTAKSAAIPADAPMPTIRGPRRSIAVGTFDAIGGYVARYGDWNPGGGVEAMMTHALMESGVFDVVERAQMADVLTEQELRAEGLTAGEEGPTPGRLRSADYIVTGGITEFGTRDSGGGFSVGVGGMGRTNIGVSPQFTKGKMAADFRLIDTSTGAVVLATNVEEKVTGSSIAASVSQKDVSLGTNAFQRTPLGQATRRVVHRAVREIAAAIAQLPWRGRVIDVEATDLYINAGGNDGIAVGDRFMIYRMGRALTDPVTGEILSQRRMELGSVTISHIEEKISRGTFTPSGSDWPQRGDFVAPNKI